MRVMFLGSLLLLVGAWPMQAHAYPDRSFALGPNEISTLPRPGESIPHVNVGFVQPPQWADIKQKVLEDLIRIVHDQGLLKDPDETKRQAEKAFDDFFRGFARILGYNSDVVITNAIAMTALHQLMIEYMDDVDIYVVRTIQNLWKFVSKNAIDEAIRRELQEKQGKEKAWK